MTPINWPKELPRTGKQVLLHRGGGPRLANPWLPTPCVSTAKRSSNFRHVLNAWCEFKGRCDRYPTEEDLKRQAADLSIITQDLEWFSYAVSHDLRASAKRQFTDPSRKN